MDFSYAENILYLNRTENDREIKMNRFKIRIYIHIFLKYVIGGIYTFQKRLY